MKKRNKTNIFLIAKLVFSGLKWVDENNVTVTDQRKDESNPLFGQVLSFQKLNLKHEIVKKRNKTNIFLIAKLVFSGLKRVDENNVTVTDQRKDESNPLFGQVFPFQELNLKHENVKKRNTTDIFLMAKLVSLRLKWVDENNVTVTDQRKD